MSMRYPGGLIASSPVNAAYPSGVWTQAQTQPYAAQNVWMRDQFWPNTTLLLQGNGTNGAQNNTFLDSSTNNFTITRNGNTTQGSFTPYEANGYWSNSSFSSSAYLTYNPGATAAFGTGDFTVEAWVFATAALSSGDNPYICDTRGGGGAWSLSWNYNGTANPWQLAWANSSVLQSSTSMALNTWNHCAYVRSGTTGTLYLNGVSIGTWTDSYNYSASVTSLRIGSRYATTGITDWLPGYLSNLRIVKGTAVYTSAFTPSAAPLTAITNTSLLTCQSNRFIDNSTNAFAITRNGDTSVQAFQPFPGATTWSGSVLGGSGYFDGTGDFLTTPTSSQFTASGNFTVSCWFMLQSFANSYYVVGGNWDAGTSDEWLIQIQNNGAIRFLTSASTSFSSSGVVKLNEWTFFSATRSGSTVTVQVNGTTVSTYTKSDTLGSATKSINIGQQPGNNWPWNGYISDFRLVSGSAVTTLPTSPLTAISGTGLLLNFTNAGIFDSAMMNNLETVGNAQVSTSVVKYGTGSMLFDGSGDYLVRPDAEFLRLSSGDFTIEAWVYLTGNQPQFDGGVASYGATTTFAGWTVGISGSSAGGTLNRLLYGVNASASGGAPLYGVNGIALNTWTHIAVTKSGTTVRLFINGSLDNSGTVTATPTTSTSYFFYVGTQAYDPTATTRQFAGYIDDLRITKGTARYIGNFTPPVARMPQQ